MLGTLSVVVGKERLISGLKTLGKIWHMVAV